MEPMTMAALMAGGSSLLGSGLSFMGGSSAAKNTREAMERYLNELRTQRKTFLDQPESQAIRKRLQSFIGGNVGYSDDTVKNMRTGVVEDYGKSLGDMTRLTKAGGAGSSGVFTPGRQDRTSRLLGQNIASNRATSMRDIATKNADVAMNNERLAMSALPTYLPGTPSTTIASPDVYNQANAEPNIGTYLGPALGNLGNLAGQYAIFSQLANASPVAQRMSMWDPVMADGMNPNTMPGDQASSLRNYYRNLSPTR